MPDLTITVKVENAAGVATGTLDLTFITPPAFVGQMPPAVAIEGQPFEYATAAFFSGLDLEFSAEGLPPGFGIDPETGLITAFVGE